MKVIRLFLAVLFLSGCSNAESQKRDTDKNERPNIVYILADDLGYGEIGAYGQEKIETPNIDALAENGMMFTQYYSGFPVCAPARSVLMTGQHAGHTYIRNNESWPVPNSEFDLEKSSLNSRLESDRPLADSVKTLGEMLHDAGYTTAAVGKWGLGGPMTEGRPTNQGFDFFFGFMGQRQGWTFYPLHLWKNNEKIGLENKIVEPHQKLPEGANPQDPASYAKFRQPDYAPDFMIREALNFIDSTSKKEPFFLYFSSPLPHVPLQAPERWVQYYHNKFGKEKPYTGDVKGLKYFPSQYPRATYAAMVSYLDEQVGQLVEKLKETEQYKNTLIILTSDNGPTYNGGSNSPWFDSAGPFKSERGWGKGYLHEGGIRVPMIASWPGVIEPASVTKHISAHYDVMATAAEIAGISIPEQTDGISFLPILEGKQEQQEKHKFLYWEFPSYGGQQAVRMGKWKGIRKNIFKGNMDIALFNLDEDIKEQQDISHKHPEIVQQIEQIMKSEHETPVLDSFKMSQLNQ